MVMLRSLLLQWPSLSSDILPAGRGAAQAPQHLARLRRWALVSTVIFIVPRPFWLTMDHMSSTLLLSSASVDSHRSRNLIQGASMTLPTSPTSSSVLSLFPQFCLTHFVA